MADHVVETLFEHFGEPLPLQGILEVGIERIDVDRQATLPPQIIECILVRRKHEFRLESQFDGDAREKALR